MLFSGERGTRQHYRQSRRTPIRPTDDASIEMPRLKAREVGPRCPFSHIPRPPRARACGTAAPGLAGRGWRPAADPAPGLCSGAYRRRAGEGRGEGGPEAGRAAGASRLRLGRIRRAIRKAWAQGLGDGGDRQDDRLDRHLPRWDHRHQGRALPLAGGGGRMLMADPKTWSFWTRRDLSLQISVYSGCR